MPSGQTVSYSCDALGCRSSRTANNKTTNFIYAGQDVMQDKNSANSEADYINGLGIDDKLKVSNTSGSLYYLKDHLGSTQGLTGVPGSVAEWQRYEAFGNSSVSNSFTRYGYTGREKDADSGLMFYRARWYDAEQGRFISQDPIGFSGGNNFYGYVGSNPLSKVDPTGLAENGGLYHAPLGVRTKCLKTDSCSVLTAKMTILAKMIASHTGWERNMPAP